MTNIAVLILVLGWVVWTNINHLTDRTNKLAVLTTQLQKQQTELNTRLNGLEALLFDELEAFSVEIDTDDEIENTKARQY
jgi:uncharacterized protein YlxW (UPF0749 family)